jgi:hypothetical protein
MRIDLTTLPDDAAVLQSMIRDVVAVTVQRDAQVTELTAEIEKLQAVIHKLLRHRFGRRSEQLSDDGKDSVHVFTQARPWSAVGCSWASGAPGHAPWMFPRAPTVPQTSDSGMVARRGEEARFPGL